MASIGRNDPCPCGSGKRAKQCCFRLGTRTAIEASPSDTYFTSAEQLWRQGRTEDALSSMRQGLALQPDFGGGQANLGLMLHELGRRGEAIPCMKTAAALVPDLAWVHANLGNMLYGERDFAGSVESYRRAIALSPDDIDVYVYLGNALKECADADSAIDCYRKVLAIRPDDANVHLSLGDALLAQGDLDGAIASLRTAHRLAPDAADAQSALLFVMNIHPAYSAAERYVEARRYGQVVAARARPYTAWSVDPFLPAQMPHRRLRVGLLSGDLRAHPVGYAIENLLAQLDATRIELVAFPTQLQEDELTRRIRPRFASWQGIAERGDDAAAATIHAAAIDVLVDLSGHTTNNRLPVLAWKPAPIQVSWLGYFATTGVPGVDYLLADPTSVPQSERAQFTETLHYLPATRLCFSPPRADDAIAPSPAPVEANGYVTFGSFQSALKLNDAVIATWSEVLRTLPTARLRLQNGQMRFPASRAHVLDRLARAGIDAGRVSFFGTGSRDDYLLAHRDVDMILDTFPYPGATTTCEALWMGVPTLTIEGDTLASRQGASLLLCVGLDDWIARDRADYVARAVAHSRDIAALSALRLSLRTRALRSPLFDTATFARNLEDALFTMWRQWAAKGGHRATENA